MVVKHLSSPLPLLDDEWRLPHEIKIKQKRYARTSNAIVANQNNAFHQHEICLS